LPFLEQTYSSKRNFFSASHFLVGFAECERLHGHNYHVTVNLQYNQVDTRSTLDFRVINKEIQTELKFLNQKILIPSNSPKIQISSSLDDKNWNLVVMGKNYSFPKQDVLILQDIDQTTCENIACYLHQRIETWFRTNYPNLVSYLKIKISENLGNHAIYSTKI
jgi:6-pyruvoyltetrahydropterin/6-carboxytetrahydropterin synthase